MYRIIIIDDEPGAQEIIARYINKSELGFEVMACLSDGEEAINYLGDNEVDIVITDIKMPRMSGLELAQKLNAVKLYIKVVIVGGYSEFEYAKKAMEFNVFNYLLKPIDVEELIDCLDIIKSILDNQRQKELHIAEMLLLQREQFFADLFMGALVTKAEISESFNRLSFPFELEDTYVEILRIELHNYDKFLKNRWQHGKENLGMAVFNVVEKVVKGAFIYPVSHKGEKMIFVLFIPRTRKVDVSTNTLEEEIKAAIQLDTKMSITNVFGNLLELAENVIIEEDENEIIMLLISHIKTGDIIGAKSTEQILKIFKKRLAIYSICLRIIIWKRKISSLIKQGHLLKLIIKKDISREDVADYVFLNSAYLGKYFKQQTGKTIYEYLISYLNISSQIKEFMYHIWQYPSTPDHMVCLICRSHRVIFLKH